MRAIALVLLCASACKAANTFECMRGDECDGPVAGTCEPTGYCAFPDGSCDSGRRYDPSASLELAGKCVPADPPPGLPIDCRDALEHGVTADGVVMIDPDGANGMPPFEVYCDMTTAGGGWTLVWVYTFTDYSNFMAGANAVTPRPTWGVPATGGTPTSTTIPLDPMTTGALDFTRWAGFGDEVLVTSNINNWLTCQPGTGSVVTLTPGSVTCEVVQVVAMMCPTTVPVRVDIDAFAVGLWAGPAVLDTYYYWEGATTTGNWPTHDPCGMNGTHQVTGVAAPAGQIYLRRL